MHRNQRPISSKRQSNGPANAAAGAGNEGDLIQQRFCHAGLLVGGQCP